MLTSDKSLYFLYSQYLIITYLSSITPMNGFGGHIVVEGFDECQKQIHNHYSGKHIKWTNQIGIFLERRILF